MMLMCPWAAIVVLAFVRYKSTEDEQVRIVKGKPVVGLLDQDLDLAPATTQVRT